MNQDKQPEALRLADELDQFRSFPALAASAAAELRRLHAESEQHLQELRSYRITVDNREARIAELEAELAAAKASISGLKKRSDDWKWRALNAESAQAQRVPLPLSEILHFAGEQGFVRVQGTRAFHAFIDGTDIAGELEAMARDIERAHGITQEKQG